MVYGFIVPIPAVATPKNSSQWGFVSVPREWPLTQVRLNRKTKLRVHGKARRRMKLAGLRPSEPRDVNSSIELEKRIPYLVDRLVRPGLMA